MLFKLSNLKRFIIDLADGWKFTQLVIEPMLGNAGRYAILVMRDD